jgi:hypothetical protein
VILRPRRLAVVLATGRLSALAGLAAGWVQADAHNWNRDLMSLVSSMGALALFFVWMRASIMTASGARAA